MSKILLLANYSERIATLNGITEPNKRQYCERHGYAFENLNLPYTPASHVLWFESIKERLGGYDIVMTVGCDTLMMNQKIRIEERFTPPRVTIAEEHLMTNWWWPLNNDIMIWPASEQSHRVLDALIRSAPRWLKYQWLAQVEMWNMIQGDFGSDFQIVHARHMNSVLQPGLGRYKIGDWVLHFADLPATDRIKYAKDFLRFVGDGTFDPDKIV
jgi:hypothetical protein